MAKSSGLGGKTANSGSGGMVKGAGGPTEATPKGSATAVSSFSLESSNSAKKGQ